MGMASNCTHHDRSKDPLAVWDTELSLTKLPLQVVVQKSSMQSGYLAVQDKQSSPLGTERYSVELRTG
jgi:hypothetical protein